MIEIIVKKDIPIKCYIFECHKCESVFRAFEEDVYKHKGWKRIWEIMCGDDHMWKTISEFSKNHKDLFNGQGWMDWDRFKKFCEESEEEKETFNDHAWFEMNGIKFNKECEEVSSV